MACLFMLWQDQEISLHLAAILRIALSPCPNPKMANHKTDALEIYLYFSKFESIKFTFKQPKHMHSCKGQLCQILSMSEKKILNK